MQSPFANIYRSLMARILTLTAGSPPLPVIAYIDLDYGQLETKERPSVAFPCILIDFQEFNFENLGSLVQTTQGIITLKLATDPYSATDSLTPDTWQQAGINILELEWQIYKLLQGWSPSVLVSPAEPQNASPLTRIHLTSDNRRPGLKVRPMAFACAFTDSSAKRTYTTASATPVITNQILT